MTTTPEGLFLIPRKKYRPAQQPPCKAPDKVRGKEDVEARIAVKAMRQHNNSLRPLLAARKGA